MEIIIFTDGSSRGNPGPGGWGTIIIENEKVQMENGNAIVTELGGREEKTTNNKMELKAVIEGLKNIKNKDDYSVKIYTDSSYVIKGITQWIKGWKRNGWMTQAKEDVINKDLWMELDELVQGKSISWQYVGGHIGIKGNERCDEIATAFADDLKIELYKGSVSRYSIKDITDISHDQMKLNDKKSSSSRSSAKAYSYVSLVDGKIEIHKTWPECEKRVKGVKARFQKSFNKEEEQEIIKKFTSF